MQVLRYQMQYHRNDSSTKLIMVQEFVTYVTFMADIFHRIDTKLGYSNGTKNMSLTYVNIMN